MFLFWSNFDSHEVIFQIFKAKIRQISNNLGLPNPKYSLKLRNIFRFFISKNQKFLKFEFLGTFSNNRSSFDDLEGFFEQNFEYFLRKTRKTSNFLQKTWKNPIKIFEFWEFLNNFYKNFKPLMENGGFLKTILHIFGQNLKVLVLLKQTDAQFSKIWTHFIKFQKTFEGFTGKYG